MVTRCISGAVLVVIALVTILSGGYILAGTLLAISCIGFYELSKACKIHGNKVNALEVVCYLAIIAFYALTVFSPDETLVLLWAVLFFLCVMGVYVLTFPKYHANQIMAAYFCVLYAPVMFSFIYRIRMMEYGIYLVWMVFIASWISDTFAYFTGVLLGKHKLAPVLSPKKSVEGSIGGVAGSALAGALFGYLFSAKVGQEVNLIVVCAVLGALGSVISQIGDLAASAIKRNQDIKDYGTLIPGHGGIMDRFDSVIVTAPIIYFLVYYFV
ncbi:MAG: phosphatidate cytidylyltransferase [Lachnospiraceae bacterium]|nr:phosphatidate cytidylyltransferase [Lachnospiraceae bacterium]